MQISLQNYRIEQPKLKATIREQTKIISNLEAKVVHLERRLATASNMLAMLKDRGCSTAVKKENGKYQNSIRK